VVAALSRTKGIPEAGPAVVIRPLGRFGDRPWAVVVRGETVLVGWGEHVLAACLEARANPSRSTGVAIRAGWGTAPPRATGAFWPGRLPSLALADAPPVLWQRRHEGANIRDDLRWSDLRGVVRRFLDRLPSEPPAER
jgi:hypothetical protein